MSNMTPDIFLVWCTLLPSLTPKEHCLQQNPHPLLQRFHYLKLDCSRKPLPTLQSSQMVAVPLPQSTHHRARTRSTCCPPPPLPDFYFLFLFQTPPPLKHMTTPSACCTILKPFLDSFIAHSLSFVGPLHPGSLSSSLPLCLSSRLVTIVSTYMINSTPWLSFLSSSLPI